MDPLTQGLLGATCGQALYGRRLGKAARHLGRPARRRAGPRHPRGPLAPMAEWLWHRGPTHALWFGLVVGPAARLAAVEAEGRTAAGLDRARQRRARHAPAARHLHELRHATLWPFSRTRVALDAVAIIDPVYTLALALAISSAGAWAQPTPAAARAAWSALASPRRIWRSGLGVNARAEAIARAQLAAEGVAGRESRPTRRCCSCRSGASSRAAARRCGSDG